MVWIFASKSRTRPTLRSHQIRVFCHRLEQLVRQEARREHKEAVLTVTNRRLSCLPVDQFLWPVSAAASE
jgi:hypothetical protein